MPLQSLEIVQLIITLILFVIPGYLWSLLLFKDLTKLERLVFGFTLSITILSLLPYLLNVFLNIALTSTTLLILYAIYTIPILILLILSILHEGLPPLNLHELKTPRTLLLLPTLAFAAFMTLLPHLDHAYYIPFHVDEWIHWSYARAITESHAAAFVNPYTGSGTIATPEIGFHMFTNSIHWLANTHYLAIFIIMPSVITIFTCLTVFNLGERSTPKFGLEAAFLIPFIPTTVRYLGPSFYVPVSLGLFLITFLLWLTHLKKINAIFLLPIFIIFLIVIHPVTAMAGIAIILIYSLYTLLEKHYKTSVYTIAATLLPILIMFIVATRWDWALDIALQALQGQHFALSLPQIWVTFAYLSIITWALFVIGGFYAFYEGDTLKRTITTSALLFLFIIGLYIKLDYGIAILYERSFMFLFLTTAITAGIALAHLRPTIKHLIKTYLPQRHHRHLQHTTWIIPIILVLIICATAVPAHQDIPYYHLINHQEYEDFTWIHNNIGQYRDTNHSYDTAAVHPFKASPFSAVTGLYTVSSSMHPLYGYQHHKAMQRFLRNHCTNTSFLHKHDISVIYGSCTNPNLTQIHPKVYLYPGLPE